jgi:hypothetical protein
MLILYKIAAPVLRAAGFLGLIVGLFYFVSLTGAAGIKESWPWGLLFLGSLAAIWIGDRLKKKIGAPE